jgi:SAM-dependent methyltransferase
VTSHYDPLIYDAVVQGVPNDVEFYVSLAKEARAAGHPVLELACGTGRVSIPIARAGVQVVGLDASPAMLGRAHEKARAERSRSGEGLTNVRWVEGDMRDFALPERFGLVIIPFRSFQHLLTVDDQLSCLRCVYQHLVAGGRFALHIFNPDIARIATWLTTRRGGAQRLSGEYRHPRSGRRARRWELPAYHPAEQQLDVSFLDEEIEDDGGVVSRVYRDLRLRYTFRFEMEHLFAGAGFEIEALYGDFARGAFDDTSVEQVWLARRPA